MNLHSPWIFVSHDSTLHSNYLNVFQVFWSNITVILFQVPVVNLQWRQPASHPLTVYRHKVLCLRSAYSFTAQTPKCCISSSLIMVAVGIPALVTIFFFVSVWGDDSNSDLIWGIDNGWVWSLEVSVLEYIIEYVWKYLWLPGQFNWCFI